MMEIINSGGIEIAVCKFSNIVLGMAKASLDEHVRKHPDIAKTHEGYLEKAAEVLKEGKSYKDGVIHNGVFVRAYPSQECGCPIVCTVHRKW